MGAVDLVVQVESPGSVSSGLQRIGRAGHQVGEPSRGKLFPKHRADLLEAAVVVQRMQDGPHRAHPLPAQPARRAVPADRGPCAPSTSGRSTTCWRWCAAAPTSPTLTDEVFHAVPRPARRPVPVRGVQRAAAPHRVGRTAGGDRAVSSVAGPAPSGWRSPTRAPSPTGACSACSSPTAPGSASSTRRWSTSPAPARRSCSGASTWRIEDITFERVIVTPAPGMPGKMPFWHGEGPGRPLELGRAIGQFVREVRDRRITPDPVATLRQRPRPRRAGRPQPGRLPRRAGRGHRRRPRRPHHRGRALPRRDRRLAGLRAVAVRRPGARARGPWRCSTRLGERWGVDVEMIWSDDGIVAAPARGGRRAAGRRAGHPARRDRGHRPRPAARHGACSPAASGSAPAGPCCCPAAGPTAGTPLWQQRQRAADLLGVAAKYPTFPILLETTRECVNDVFDLPALEGGAPRHPQPARCGSCRSRPTQASPMAQSLLFGWIAVYMYEGDAPARRAPGRRAGARPRPAPRAARLRGAARADRRRRARRPRARAAAPGRGPPGPRRRRGPRPAARCSARSPPSELAAADRRRRRGARSASSADDRRAYVRRHRRRGPLGGHRGRRPAARRARRRRAARPARRLHRPGRRPAGRPGRPLRPHATHRSPPRSVAAALRHHHRPCAAGARTARGRGPPAARRVPARRPRARVDRPRRAAQPAAPIAGRPAPRGRAGRGRRARPVPAVVARHRCRPPGHRRAGRRRGPAAGRADRRVGARDRRAPGPARRLPARRPRPAVRHRRRRLGRRRIARRARDGRIRLLFRDQAALLVPTVDPVPDGAAHEAILEHLAARGASFWSDLVAACQQAGADYDDATGPGRAVGPGLGRPRHQRLARTAALVPRRHLPTGTPERPAVGRPTPTRSAVAARPARRRRSLVAGRAAAGTGTHAPPRRPTPRPASCSSATGCSPARRRWGRGARAASPACTRCSRRWRSGARSGAATSWPGWVRRSSRCPVRSTGCVRSVSPAASTTPWCWPPPIRPSPTAPPCPGPTHPAGRPDRPARTWCCATATWSPTSSGAATRSPPSPTPISIPSGRRRSRQLVDDGRYRSLEIRKVDGEPVRESSARQVLEAAGFRDGYRGLVLRPG